MKVKTHNTDQLKRTSKIREKSSRMGSTGGFLSGELKSSTLMKTSVIPSD